MAKYIGVDWAARGWFGVVLSDGGSVAADLFPSIWSVWKYHSDAVRILIDIPIGLPEVEIGRRECDVEAKRLLGRQHRSVFYTPIREAVYETNLDRAKEKNEVAGFSIQNQAWAIVPRIREVDEFLDQTPGARDRLVETHPELCFRMLHGRPLEHVKTTPDGIAERRDILAAEDERVTAELADLKAEYLTPSYSPTVGGTNDILDAVVAALVARRSEDELRRLPYSPPPTDARGLPMQILCPAGVEQVKLDAIG